MAVNLSMLAGAGAQFFTDSGVPLNGGLVYTYAAGTTTPQTAYTTSAGNVAHTNPIVLNSAGRVASGGEIWLTDAIAYKFVLATAAAVTIATYDNVTGNGSGIYVALAASSGSSLVGFLQSGSGAVATTVQAKLRQTVSVKDFGAIGDGVTNDTVAIQAALTAADSVYFPSGTYLTNTVTLKTNQFIYGDGKASIIKQNTTTGASYGTLYADSDSASTFITGITIRDIQILGQVATLGFSEFQHLISLNGVDGALIDNVYVTGFRGDGIYLGSSPTAGVERHNRNVTVTNCVIDGVNNDNRNGISVIDGNGVSIASNVFKNCTRSNMPGPVDVESNAVAYALIKDITIINNQFYSCGGSQLIGISTTAIALTQPLSGLIISANYFDSTNTNSSSDLFIKTAEVISSVAPMGISITNNTHKTSRSPFVFRYVKDLVYDGNHSDGGSVSEVGDATSATLSAYDIKIVNNSFINSSNSVGCLQIANVNFLNINGNTFQPKSTNVNGITFFGSGVTTISSDVSIVNNKFIKGASQTRWIHVSSHTLTPNTNNWSANDVSGGALTNSFRAIGIGLGQCSADKGNADSNITACVDPEITIYNTPITATRTVLISTTNAFDGANFRVVRTASSTGAFSVDVGTGPLKSLSAAGQWADVSYNAQTAAWILTGYGSL